MANLIENKKAGLNYDWLETYETGIELLGGEVKSLKGKQGSLEGARVIIRGGEAYLVGTFVPP
ncbi:MAG: SsrA-binding protein, partial [Candidatus Vogelbacteria bacterium]|nr:SsrA-binding protein [Candidatus Vogelbacteria bacterium]